MSYKRGPYTKSKVRKLAKAQGYRIASLAQAYRSGWWAWLWVWGWDKAQQRILVCRFYACHENPEGFCELPPVADTVFSSGGVQSNQLRLDLRPST